MLRLAGGYTKRANSINPHFGSTHPLHEKIAHCEEAYRERGLPTIFRLTPFSQTSNLDEALAMAGYEAFDYSLVMAATLANWLRTRGSCRRCGLSVRSVYCPGPSPTRPWSSHRLLDPSLGT
ncbi:MAG: hypothetical protein E4H08_06155 [Candidatus Atribacteria bacterium]|nr:MAG: hypothetical protein E4H08_06155 [Candidatus Atribacteria bacterium]